MTISIKKYHENLCQISSVRSFVLDVLVIRQCTQDMGIVFPVGEIVMPKKIFGCDYCNSNIELNLLSVKPSQFRPNKLLTTYKCPKCGGLYWDSETIKVLNR